MFKFTFEGVQYALKFARFDENNWIPGLGRNTAQLVTVAQILTKTGSSTEDEFNTLYAVGYATRYFKDQNNFAEGRKQALLRALSAQNREFRLAVWAAYNARKTPRPVTTTVGV